MHRFFAAALALTLLTGSAAATTPAAPITLTLQDHRFTPATITVPAGQRVQLIVVNQDAATEEFDSHDLRVEKLVTPHARASVFIGPLNPGTYSFMGEFHPGTAQGRVIAVAGR
jgi:plastocyanin